MTNPLFDALFAPLAGRETPLLILPDAAPIRGDAFLKRVLQMAQALVALGLQPGPAGAASGEIARCLCAVWCLCRHWCGAAAAEPRL